MKLMGFILVVMAAIFALTVLPTLGQLDDGPWPMFHHDLRHTGRSQYVGPDEPTLKWSFATDGTVYSSPAVGADSTIYVGSDDHKLYAINPDGSLKWSYTTGGDVRSSPAVGNDGTIYVGSRDHKIYAINSDGSLKWSYHTSYEIYSSSPVLNADGTIYVGSTDSKVYAINPDGSLKWSYKTGKDVNSSPAVDFDGIIYIGSRDNKLYAINQNGSLKWSYTTGDTVRSSPAVGADGTIYVGSIDYKLYAISPDGSLKWSYPTGGYVSCSPALGDDGTIYIGLENYDLFYAINPDGSLKWSFNMGGSHSSPALDAKGCIYVGSWDQKLYAIEDKGNFATIRWSYTTDGWVHSSPAVGVDGTIYVGSYDNKLYAIVNIATIQFDPYQDRVPRGGTLDFEGIYTNWADTLVKPEVIFEAYLPGGTEPQKIFSNILTFYPGVTTKYYTLTVPVKAPTRPGYLLKGKIIVPPGSGEVASEDNFEFEVKPAMESLPFGFE
jgi:outer membrane protein assembly factor BamB